MKTCFHWLGFVAVMMSASVVNADVMYECIDDMGNKTFSNMKSVAKGDKCTPMSLPDPVTVPATRSRSSASSNPSPASFPKVKESDQKARDNDRKAILESEKSTERAALEQAKKALAEQEAIRNGDERNYQKVLDRLAPYKEKVSQHERNLDAIDSELTRLK